MASIKAETRAQLVATFPTVWIQPATEAFDIRDRGVYWSPKKPKPSGLTEKPADPMTMYFDPGFTSNRSMEFTAAELQVLSEYVLART